MIELKHLRTLQALRKTGSLAAASTVLHQTQSALSHQFSELEQRLGYRLFIRKSQPLQFTSQGNILLELSDQVLPLTEMALQKCKYPALSILRLAIECHSCIHWLTPALEQFRQRWPDIALEFKPGVTFEPQPALLQGELDIVLTSDRLADSGLHYIKLFDYEVRLLLSPEHPLASQHFVRPDDLTNETLLIYPVRRQRMDIWRYFLQPAGIVPEIKQVDNTALLIQMVTARMGVAALPHWAIENAERYQLITSKSIGTGLWSSLYCAVRSDEQHISVINTFIETVNQHVSKHLPFVRYEEQSSDNAAIEKAISLFPQ